MQKDQSDMIIGELFAERGWLFSPIEVKLIEDFIATGVSQEILMDDQYIHARYKSLYIAHWIINSIENDQTVQLNMPLIHKLYYSIVDGEVVLDFIIDLLIDCSECLQVNGPMDRDWLIYRRKCLHPIIHQVSRQDAPFTNQQKKRLARKFKPLVFGLDNFIDIMKDWAVVTSIKVQILDQAQTEIHALIQSKTFFGRYLLSEYIHGFSSHLFHAGLGSDVNRQQISFMIFNWKLIAAEHSLAIKPDTIGMLFYLFCAYEVPDEDLAGFCILSILSNKHWTSIPLELAEKMKKVIERNLSLEHANDALILINTLFLEADSEEEVRKIKDDQAAKLLEQMRS